MAGGLPEERNEELYLQLNAILSPQADYSREKLLASRQTRVHDLIAVQKQRLARQTGPAKLNPCSSATASQKAQKIAGPAILAVQRGLKVSSGTVGDIEAVMVLTLRFLNSAP